MLLPLPVRSMRSTDSMRALCLAASLCDRLVLLRHGRVLADGPTADVLTSHAIRALYDVEADVQFHEQAGHLTVVPVARTR